jgi:UDP-N-acetylmuramate--alanine ligase
VPSTARWGEGGDFVVEADEYAGNFDAYRPAIAVLLNAEWDHPDVFADEAAVLDAFETWIRAAASGQEEPILLANAGDAGVARLLPRLADWPGRVVTCALDDGEERRDVDVRGQALARGVLRITLPATAPVEATLALSGRHNAANALCVAAAAWVLGVPADRISAGLTSFPGVGRRLELKGEPRGVAVLDDYAHHPTAVAASIAALRDRYPGRRLWAVYEPLTFHRTAAMLDAFADVLGRADRVAIADIWAGRDPDTSIVSAQRLADAVRSASGTEATAPGSVEATADALSAEVEPGDVVLVMGGGRSYVIAERLIALLGGSGPAVG